MNPTSNPIQYGIPTYGYYVQLVSYPKSLLFSFGGIEIVVEWHPETQEQLKPTIIVDPQAFELHDIDDADFIIATLEKLKAIYNQIDALRGVKRGTYRFHFGEEPIASILVNTRLSNSY